MAYAGGFPWQSSPRRLTFLLPVVCRCTHEFAREKIYPLHAQADLCSTKPLGGSGGTVEQKSVCDTDTKCITCCDALRGCLAVKFDSCNNCLAGRYRRSRNIDISKSFSFKLYNHDIACKCYICIRSANLKIANTCPPLNHVRFSHARKLCRSLTAAFSMSNENSRIKLYCRPYCIFVYCKTNSWQNTAIYI